MKVYQFIGIEETNVGMPDMSVVTVKPGDAMALPYDLSDSPLWKLAKGKATVDTPDHIPSKDPGPVPSADVVSDEQKEA